MLKRYSNVIEGNINLNILKTIFIIFFFTIQVAISQKQPYRLNQ